MDKTPEQIAAGLTHDAVIALLKFDAEKPDDLLIVEHGDDAVVSELFQAGCIAQIFAVYRFIQMTPLGLAVRAILQAQENTNALPD